MGKTIVVVGEAMDDVDSYDEDAKISLNDRDRVIVKNIDPTSGEKLRGYSADVVILTCAVSTEVKQRVIEPMLIMGQPGELIEL